MTKQDLAVPWPLRAAGSRHRLSSILLAAFIAGLVVAGAVEAKQQCSVSAAKQGYWSWRMIDGRKCWYEGKPKLSKAMLEWPGRTRHSASQMPMQMLRALNRKHVAIP
jgi:hypothetical protein